jgi:hypothetical protein
MDNGNAKLKHCHGLDIVNSIMVLELGMANFKHCHGLDIVKSIMVLSLAWPTSSTVMDNGQCQCQALKHIAPNPINIHIDRSVRTTM